MIVSYYIIIRNTTTYFRVRAYLILTYLIFRLPNNGDDQGLRNGFHLGVAHSNADFEKVDFQKNIYIEFRNLGVARATPATPVP